MMEVLFAVEMVVHEGGQQPVPLTYSNNRKSRNFEICLSVGANKLMIFWLNRPTENLSDKNGCFLLGCW